MVDMYGMMLSSGPVRFRDGGVTTVTTFVHGGHVRDDVVVRTWRTQGQKDDHCDNICCAGHAQDAVVVRTW